MKIELQYIVKDHNGNFQVLYWCKGGEYFITNTGAFNQREMRIISISEDEAVKVINQSKNKTQQ